MTDLFIKQKALTEIESLRASLADSFSTSPIEEKDYHFEFSIKEEKNTTKVLMYFGKKGVRKVIQGNPSEGLNYILDSGTQDETDEPEEYIGSDETGKGDLFGPLVTCAVYVNQEIAKRFREIGVRDSKDLSVNQIDQIAKKIIKIAPDTFEIISINPKRYNELYEKFRNINELLNWSHSKAIENLLQRKNAGTIITDKFRKKDLKFSSDFDLTKYNIIQETKAEKYTAVAAASILAKHKQLQWFNQQEKSELPLKRGASSEVKELAENIISKEGIDKISEIAKLHFKTIKNLI